MALSSEHGPCLASGPAAAGWARGIAIPLPRSRRLAFFVLVVASMLAGVGMMFEILRANGMTVLEWTLLTLFAVNFSWITLAFWTAVGGFVVQLLGLEPLSLRRRPAVPAGAPITQRTAIVMPVYNEDAERVLAGIQATWRELAARDACRHFDWFLLSDSNDPAIAAAEKTGCQALRAELPAGERIYYRRRADNRGRKPGNIADFCRRWGGAYEHMIVLDADSVMTAESLLSLVRVMEANPNAGLIQTVPLPVRQITPFGRFTQFAARLFSSMLAYGFSLWQTDTANYWGHNAIIRVPAFAQACDLPELPGQPPLGGEILSHDFVEAALLRRSGWHVYLLPEIGGSYEEVPSNILDFAKRDRRWCQGNLQHMRLLFSHGLHPLSRLHFVMGATSFLASLFWLVMLGLSTLDAMLRAIGEHDFFGQQPQMFPDWPIARTDEIMSLLAITAIMLLLPKVLGILLALLRPSTRRAFGGAPTLLAGATVEMAFAILIAPIMMTYHAWFVVNILAGRNAKWGPQSRYGRAVPWREALARSGAGLVIAVPWGAATWWITPAFFWWLTPILVGLILAPGIIVASSHLGIGRTICKSGLLATPEETRPPQALAHVDDPITDTTAAGSDRATAPILPAERPRRMPTQSLARGPHWRRVAPRGT